MRRRKFLPILAIGLLSTALAACTSFTPVYGDRTGGGVEAIRLNFATPSNRVEQLIMNRLKVAFPGQPGPNDPVLDIGASVTTLPGSQSDAYSVARPTNIRLEAALSIVGADGELLFQATRFVDTSMPIPVRRNRQPAALRSRCAQRSWSGIVRPRPQGRRL